MKEAALLFRQCTNTSKSEITRFWCKHQECLQIPGNISINRATYLFTIRSRQGPISILNMIELIYVLNLYT